MAKEYITLYRWGGNDSIHQVEVRQQENGRAVAYIEADNRAEMAELRHNIRSVIRLKGWGTLSDHRNGKFVLRVTGLRNGDELVSLLQSDGFVTGQPNVVERETVPQARGFKEWIKSDSLKISGILATIGNILSMSNGVHRSWGKQKDWGQMGKGFFFMLGDLPLLLAGERDDSRQLTDLLRQLKKHYENDGVEIPKNASIMVETSNRGKTVGQIAMDYLHRYANQFKCSMEVLAAGSSIFAGKKQENKFKQYAPYVWGPGFLATLLIPERKIDAEKYATAGPLQRLWMRIQEKPLKIGGNLGYSNNIADLIGARMEYKKWDANGRQGPRYFAWDVATPLVMLGANRTYSISEKSVGGSIEQGAMVSDIYSITAQILNKQPEELREKAMESTARFLGARPEISDTHAQILERLSKEMQIQRQNPWFEKQGLPSRAPQSAGQVIQPNPLAEEAPHPVALSQPLTAQAITTPKAANENHLEAINDNPPPATTITTHQAQLAASQAVGANHQRH